MPFSNAIDDRAMAELFRSVKTIALVGASNKPHRPSNGVLRYLLDRGYQVHPVNPGLARQKLHGQLVYASLKDVPGPFDMVDVFRRSEEITPLMTETTSLLVDKSIKVFWTQLDVWDEAAAEAGIAAGLQVVMDKCPAIEIPRLERAGLL